MLYMHVLANVIKTRVDIQKHQKWDVYHVRMESQVR